MEYPVSQGQLWPSRDLAKLQIVIWRCEEEGGRFWFCHIFLAADVLSGHFEQATRCQSVLQKELHSQAPPSSESGCCSVWLKCTMDKLFMPLEVQVHNGCKTLLCFEPHACRVLYNKGLSNSWQIRRGSWAVPGSHSEYDWKGQHNYPCFSKSMGVDRRMKTESSGKAPKSSRMFYIFSH